MRARATETLRYYASASVAAAMLLAVVVLGFVALVVAITLLGVLGHALT